MSKHDPKMVRWEHYALVIGAEPIQVNRITGNIEYAACEITQRHNVLSYCFGVYAVPSNLPPAGVCVLRTPEDYERRGPLGDFVLLTHLRDRAPKNYAGVWAALEAVEKEFKVAKALEIAHAKRVTPPAPTSPKARAAG